MKTTKLRIICMGDVGGRIIDHMADNTCDAYTLCLCHMDTTTLSHYNAHTTFLWAGDSAKTDTQKKFAHFVDGADMVLLCGDSTMADAWAAMAKIVKDKGIFCVGVCENSDRTGQTAIEKHIEKHVDTLIVTDGHMLLNCVYAIGDLIAKPGHIALDTSDIRAVLTGSSKANIGIGKAHTIDHQEHTVQTAIQVATQKAIANAGNMGKARSMLLHITASQTPPFTHMTNACHTVRQSVHADTNVICGTSLNTTPAFAHMVRVFILW